MRRPAHATYDGARQAARIVPDGAGSASLEHIEGDGSGLSGPVARPKTAVVRDDLDLERWLDEGGSFSTEAVTR
jgi:hypothetical protein